MTETPRADELLTALISGDPQIEAFATLTDEYDREKALHVLIAMLTDPSDVQRLRAVQALGAMRDKRAMEPLLKILESIEDSFEYDLVDAAVNGLIRLGDPETIVPLMTHADVRRSKVLRHNFNKFNTEDLLRVLGEVVTSPDGIHECAFEILIEIDDPRIIPLLITGLDDDYYGHIRWNCTAALQGWGVTALPFIIPHITDPSIRVRRQAAMALGILGDTQTIPALLPMLEDAEETIRVYAAIALAALGDGSGLPVLKRISERDNETLRVTAQQAIDAIKG